ncbi:NAD(P)-dependent oxidoreductase [Luteococcus sp. H138]|uniref:NAD(P)-dependent oxidoreductase n=1 Tax=unclassified Luteococcus TaxID=2639923 RepID=UPI00313C21EB
MSIRTIGWIGLGAMGAPMALVAAKTGFEVTAFDLGPDAMGRVAPSVAGASSAREAAQGKDMVAIMVATGPQLESVLFGDGGIAKVLGQDTVVMVMATVGPSAIEQVRDQLAPITTHLVDAPVSGGVVRAGKGDLLMMVSGAPADVERARPVLDALASSAPSVGDIPGDGQRFKVVNQLLCGVHIAVAGEALALADSMGLDVKQVHEVLGAGAAASFMFGDRGQRMVDGDHDEVRSALDIFVKDMGIVSQAAREVAQEVPLAVTAEQLYLRGRRQGLGRKDDSVVVQLLRGNQD